MNKPSIISKAIRKVSSFIAVANMNMSIAIALLIMTISVSATSKPLNDATGIGRVKSIGGYNAPQLYELPTTYSITVSHAVFPIRKVSTVPAVGVWGVQFVDLCRLHSAQKPRSQFVEQPPTTYLSSDRDSSVQSLQQIISCGNTALLKGKENNMKQDSEQYLMIINRARQGDTQARDHILMDSVIKRICMTLYLRGFYQGRDKEQEDLLQEVLLKILANICKAKEFKDLGHFYRWVKKIAKNVCYTAHRKDQYLLEKNVEDVFENPDSHYYSPTYEEDVLLSEVMRLVRTLNALDQSIFHLCLVEGFSKEEVARALGRTRQTIHRRLAKIEEILSPYSPRRT